MHKKKRAGLITKLLVLLFALYVAYTLISLQIQINSKQGELETLSAQNSAQKIKNDELKDLLNGEMDDQFLADAAREKLGYAAEGERVFVDTSSK